MAHLRGVFDSNVFSDCAGVQPWAPSEVPCISGGNQYRFWMGAQAGVIILYQLVLVLAFVNRIGLYAVDAVAFVGPICLRRDSITTLGSEWDAPKVGWPIAPSSSNDFAVVIYVDAMSVEEDGAVGVAQLSN